MPYARPSAPPGVKKGLGLFVQVAGLLATGCVMWITAVSPRVHRYSWATLVETALDYAVFAMAWSLAITLGLYLLMPRRERADIVWGTLRTSSTAVWFAPAIILLSQMSPAALAAALVLVVSATRLLYSEWRLLHPPEDPVAEYASIDQLFGEAEPRPWLLRELVPALSVAVCLQSGAIEILLHTPLVAGALFAMSASLLTVVAISSGAANQDRPRDLPRSILGVLLTVLLAAGLTVGGMSGRVPRGGLLAGDSEPGRSLNPVEATRALLRDLFYGEEPPDLHKTAEAPTTKDGRDQQPVLPQEPVPDGSYPGVILVSDVRPVTRLVSPVTARSGLSGIAPQPYSILFGGEYWMYRWLYKRPPPNSFLRKGTPATLSFSTTDHWPLLMEAHQKLDQPIDLNCCSRVQVEIRNADRYPGTVWLELFATGDAAPGSPSRSLGSAQVQSLPNLKNDPIAAVPETLQFAIPAEDALNACDEFKVVFRRDRSRQDKSARVAIERFVLVPKGM